MGGIYSIYHTKKLWLEKVKKIVEREGREVKEENSAGKKMYGKYGKQEKIFFFLIEKAFSKVKKKWNINWILMQKHRPTLNMCDRKIAD